jgi:hypothetical protein
MNSDDELDQLVAEHLSKRLDPHVGKTRAAFEAMRAAERRDALRRRLFVGSMVSAGGLIAASIAIAWGVWSIRWKPIHPPIAKQDVPLAAAVALKTGPQDLQRVVTWETLDDGMEVIDGKTPMRKLRREEIEEVQWFDPENKATIRMTIPREQVVLVEMKRF